MRRIAKLKKQRMCALAAAIVASAWMPTAMAAVEVGNQELPKGASIYKETADVKTPIIAEDGKHEMTVEVKGSRGAIDWATFNIGKDARVVFKGAPGFKVLNRVPDATSRSKIYGELKSFVGDNKIGGTVFLINPQGIMFGDSACVEVGGLVASTLDTDKDKFLNVANNTFEFTQGKEPAVIKNLAEIKAKDGIVALLAHKVESGEYGIENQKSITAGEVAMAAGKKIKLDLLEVQYDDKIAVRFNRNNSNGVTILNEKKEDPGYDADASVTNFSTVNAERGYVLMTASAAEEIGKNLVAQLGKVKAATQLGQDKGGNIILQAENVYAGGELEVTGNNAEIDIYGNSMVTGGASATDDGGIINIDTKDGASIILAGAKLHADKEVNTRSNHSVLVLDKLTYNGKDYNETLGQAEIQVGKKGGAAGNWNITASKVKVGKEDGNAVDFNLTDSDINLMEKALSYEIDYDKLSDENKAKVNELTDLAYTISDRVISKTLETSNVNIKTDLFSNHYVFTEKGLEDAAKGHYSADGVNGDNNIDINADITKAGGDKVTSLTMNAKGKVNLNADIMTDEKKAKALNVTLGASGITSISKSQYPNIEYEPNQGDKYITVNNGERKITTWGKDNTAGKVTINSKVDSADADNHSSLTIKSGDTIIEKNVGDTEALNNLSVYAKGSITVNGSVKADDKVVAVATDTPNEGNYRDAKDADGIQNVTVKAINAKTVTLAADNDVILNGNITANAEDNNQKAVEIVAQGKFLNENNSAINVNEEKGCAWKIYSANPWDDNLGNLDSNNYAYWGWGTDHEYIPDGSNDGNRFIFKYNPVLTYTVKEVPAKKKGDTITDTGSNTYTVTMDEDRINKYQKNFLDGTKETMLGRDGVLNAYTESEGYAAEAEVKEYPIYIKNAQESIGKWGYIADIKNGTLTVIDTSTPTLQDEPKTPTNDDPKNPGYLVPQQDALTTSNLKGSASYTTAARQAAPGADRVLGLQSAELPFFREENGQTKLYGTYDVSIDPDKVKMEPTAKVLPEPDQPQNQYREYEKEISTEAGTAKFKMTYNGSTFDIYPVDSSAKNLLVAGDAAKNVEVESQALFAAFKEMGITLDDLDGVYTHFDSKKEVQSFRK